MIKKLRKRIFLLMMISLSVVVLGVILLFSILNYRNTINVPTSMVERFVTGDREKNRQEGEEPPELPEKPETIENQSINLEGVYNIRIKNDEVVEDGNNTTDDTIQEYAIKASKKNSTNGIIGNYIYRIRQARGNEVEVILIENEEAVTHVKVIIISAVLGSMVSIIIIYVIAKKISKLIVTPVEETFEKQKQFISDASHELKTPLAVIEANSDVLENEVGSNKWLGYIQNEIESMDKLINELLLLAKMENIDNVKEYQSFNLSKEVEIVLSMFESMAYEKNVTIHTEIQENMIMNGNKQDIEHIVSTLTDNAIKHTEPEKEIRVELKKEKNEIILQVKNMGDPIPEEEREKIFERFYRIDKSRNRQEKRYGLGLAIAKSTVEKYHGKLEVSYQDGFTVFTVSLPSS